MKQTKHSPSGKVVPFTGEFYPIVEESSPPPDRLPSVLVLIAATLVAGLSLGAIVTYQSADQVKLRQMEADSQQLQQVKTQVCKE